MKKILMIFVATFTLGVFVSCDKEEAKPSLSIKNNEISIYHEGTEKLIIENAVGNTTYVSENNLIADVSEDGVITGGVKGSTKITVIAGEETAVCNVEVKARINFIPEPYQGFGESYETVKNEIKNDGDVIDNNGNLGILKTIDGTKFIYLYTFENDKLDTSGFAFSSTSKTLTSVIDFLLERYVPVKQTGTYSYALLSSDKKTVVIITPSDNLETMLVIYAPFTESKSATNANAYSEAIKKMF